jgi:DNA-binding NarL/FixJ family response regulator
MDMRLSKAKVMLVDDHVMVRYGMAMLINLQLDMEVSAEAGDGEEALATLRGGHHPDIMSMDVSLKTCSGLNVIKSVHSEIPALPVLVVSLHDEAVYAERALAAGARGYMMKQESGKVLVAAIREILKGNYYLSKKMQTRFPNWAESGNAGAQPSVNRHAPENLSIGFNLNRT